MKNKRKHSTFILGEDHRAKLKKLAHYHELNSSEYLRKLIDEKYLEMLTKKNNIN